MAGFTLSNSFRVCRKNFKSHLWYWRRLISCRISRWFQIWPPFWPQRLHFRAQEQFPSWGSNETVLFLGALSIFLFIFSLKLRCFNENIECKMWHKNNYIKKFQYWCKLQMISNFLWHFLFVKIGIGLLSIHCRNHNKRRNGESSRTVSFHFGFCQRNI